MADITQRHLNSQLEQYCQLNGGMYNQVQVYNEHELIPPNFDIDTIIFQKQGKSLVAYWHENGQVVERALRLKDAQDILKRLPRSGISQNRKLLNKVLEKYECNVSPNLSFIEDNGNCNGWSFLYPYYVSTGREREFNALRKYIAKWKGSFDFDKLPAELRNQYDNGNEVFQQLINDLVWFQHSPTKLQSLYGGIEKRKLTQDDRKRQYSMLKLPGLAITDICFFGDRGIGEPATIRNENVLRVMEFYAQWPDSWIDFTLDVGGAHAVSAYITKDGKFKYYDSNNKDIDVKELTASECLSAMEAEYAPINIVPKVKGINLHKFHGPMMTDALNNHKEFTSYDPETARILLKNAFKLGQVEFAEFLLRDYITVERSAEFINQNRILTDISAETQKDIVNLMVRYGAVVNRPVSDNGWTPLHIACTSGNGSVVRTLRRHHANINAVDSYGATPLHYAARFGSASTMRYLIKHGADLSVRDNNGYTLLHYAALGKNTPAMREILNAAQVDINARDNRGNTALHFAAKMGMAEQAQRLNQIDMIKLLRHYDVDRNAVNDMGQTPIEGASNPGAKAALRDQILTRAKWIDNIDPHLSKNRPKKKKPVTSKSTRTSSSSSSSPPSSTSSSSSSDEESTRRSPTLLGSIPVGAVTLTQKRLNTAMEKNEVMSTREPIVSRSNVESKKEFFEEKIREQSKENTSVPTRPRRR